jgi:hypothetical protein
MRKDALSNAYITRIPQADRLLLPRNRTRKRELPIGLNNTRRLLWQSPKLQKGEAGLQSHGLALPISHDPRTTRVFAFHGSALLHLLGTQNARTQGNHHSKRKL